MCPVLSQALSRMGNEGRVSLRPLHLLGITVEPCQGESESWLVTLGTPRNSSLSSKDQLGTPERKTFSRAGM